MLVSHAQRIRKRIKQTADQLASKIYLDKRPVSQLLVSPATDRISYQEAQELKYSPVTLGKQFVPLWATFWFQGKATLPPEWTDKRIDLIWVAHYCESTLWLNGQAKQSLNYSFGKRSEATLLSKAKKNQEIEFQIEMACNTSYGEWPPEKPYSHVAPYILDNCELAVFDPLAWKIYFDFLVLQQLEASIDSSNNTNDKAFGAELLYELNRFANEYNPNDNHTWNSSHKILTELLNHHNGAHVHEISAIGEGHLDLAWWWPLAETWRKIIRTASNQLGLMDVYPEYKFACSQAYLYNELKQRMPELYQRIKEKIVAKQWIPVGGMWVESDCNLPAGESLARQFLYGQRFFKQEFGFRASECWLQDAFGFNAQMPQLIKLSGMNRFVSQKLLWADPKPPHRLFCWIGLDGSTVLAHFPANSIFSAEFTLSSIGEVAQVYPDNSYSNHSLVSYGLGDGGGGPTPSMIEIISRLKDLQGTPKITMRSPADFFSLVEKDLKNRPPATWTGELYFPRHRGTFTTQAATKKMMRAAEISLHNTEFLSAMAFKLNACVYPQDQLEHLWKTVLLNQFHDIIPGTAIKIAHEEAVEQLQGVMSDCQKLCHEVGFDPAQKKTSTTDFMPINTTGFNRYEVIDTPTGQTVLVEAASYGAGKVIVSNSVNVHVTVSDTNGKISLENENLIAEFETTGNLLRLFHKATQREALSALGNRLQIYDDQTLDYDAWEIEPFHIETVKDCLPASSYKIQGNSLRQEIVFERKIGQRSYMQQIVRLDACSQRLEFHCEVDWQEEHKLLKVFFPAAIISSKATFATQFGALERPTHRNTCYEQAQFEVPGQRWVDLSEHGFGVTLLSDYKYGFSVYENEIRLSLLRAPKSPDPTADIGKHHFVYAVMPHSGNWEEGGVVAEASKFSYPLIWVDAAGKLPVVSSSFARTDDPNLVIDTIKKAEDSDGLILRFYECHGARGTAHLKLDFPFARAKFTNILEDTVSDASVSNEIVHIPYRPFEIVTLLII